MDVRRSLGLMVLVRAMLLASFVLLVWALWHPRAKLEARPVGAPTAVTRNLTASESLAVAASSDEGQALSTACVPFIGVVPSQDGTELFMSIGGIDELCGTICVNTGTSFIYPPPCCTTAACLITVPGLTPRIDESVLLHITSTLGLDITLDVARAYIPAATLRTISSIHGNLELRLVSTDTITFDTYAAVAPSYAPPAPAPLGHRFIGSTYSVHAADALLVTDSPMLLRLHYNDTALAGADPYTLAIFAWDAFNKRWDNLGGRHLYDQQYVQVATSHFTTYALMSTPAWRDDFDDLGGLNLAETSNVTLGLREGYVELLVLSYMATSGTAVSKPITPTTVITSWGTLTFTRTVDPPTTTLTVDVLSLDGTELLTDVPSGASLAGIDPVQYPSLKLRANLSSTVAGETPALDEWQLTWQPKACYDVNGDDAVDITDIQDVASHWHGLLPYDPDYDAVPDGVINILDVMKVAANWGERCGGTLSAP